MNNNYIKKTELININSLYFLYNYKDVPQDDKTILKKILKNIESGFLNINYQYLNDKKNNKLGFLYAIDNGLQNLTDKSRDFMCKDLYYLIDISDSLIFILIDWTTKNKLHNDKLKYFNKKNMDKSFILSILYGNIIDIDSTTFIESLINEVNNIAKWAWDNHTEYRSMTIDYLDKKRESHKKKKTMLLYNILCTITNSIILQIDSFLTSKGRSIDTFIFDKVLIRKLPGELLYPTELVLECENNIKEMFGIDIALNISEMISDYNNPHKHNIVPYNVSVNPRYAAEKFKQLMGNNLVFSDNKLWIYDDKSEIYHADIALLNSKIVTYKDSLVFKQYNKKMDEKFYDYYGDLDKRRNMIKILPEICYNVPEFFKDKSHIMGDGKLLLRKKCGYSYAVTRYDDNNMPDFTRVKLGYFKNIKIEREIYNNYSRILTPICVLYILPTVDAELAEKIVHHALDKVRIDPHHEIFNLKNDLNIYYDTVNMIKIMDKNSGKEMPWRTNVSYKYWQVAIDAAKIGRNKIKEYEKKVESTKHKKTKLEIKNNKKNVHDDINQSLLNTFYKYYERTVSCNDSKVHISHITDIINKYSGISKKNENEIKEILKSVDIAQKKTTMRLNGNPVRGWYIGYKLKEKL